MTDSPLLNAEVERAALGAMLLDNSLIAKSGLSQHDFGLPAHGKVFSALEVLAQDGEADLVAVMDYLDATGDLSACGGPEVVSDITSGIPRLSTIDHYVHIIRTYATRRRIMAAAKKLEKLAREEADEAEIVAKAENVLASARLSRAFAMFGGHELVEAEFRDSEERIKDAPRGVKWGMPGLDEFTRPCIMRGSAWFVGARPSVGKSSFLIGMADFNIRMGKKVLFIACEMGGNTAEGCVRLTWRLAGQTAAVPLTSIRTVTEMNASENERYLKSLAFYQGATNFLLAYHPRPTTSQVRAIIRQAAGRLGGLDLVVLDYFQKVRPNKRRQGLYEERAEVAGDLVAIAGSEGVPLIIGSQLHREAEGEDSQKNRPGLGNLKGAGEQEQEATGVILLHRWGHRSPNPPSVGAEIILAKQQDGPVGTLNADFDRVLARWSCPSAHDDFPPPEN